MATNEAVVKISRGELNRRLEINGLSVRNDAVAILEGELKHGSPPYSSVEHFIHQLLDVIYTMPTETTLIDADFAQQAVQLLRDKRHQYSTQSTSVVIRNVTEELPRQDRTLTNFKHHYSLLVKALKKQAVFQSGQFRLTTVDELNTYDSSLQWNCIVFGLIRKDPSRIMQYLLEDVTGKIPVIFSSEVTNYREWCTVENAIYLVEGIYQGDQDSFVVTSIGLPPPINQIFPASEQHQERESLLPSSPDQMVILLSDIHLDHPRTINALKFLFAGYNSVPQVPDMFVLMGNFTSTPVDRFTFKDHMKNLVKLISTFKRLAEGSRFVFVPGANDPVGSSELWIRKELDAEHFPTTTTKLANYHLATNPFHLQIEGRRVTLIAQPVIGALLKNVIHSTERLNQVAPCKNQPPLMDSFLNSLGRVWFCSAHLTSGLNRNFIDSMSLMPKLPELILIADPDLNRHHSCTPYPNLHLSTITSFTRGDFQFLVYYVNEARLEESQISL